MFHPWGKSSSVSPNFITFQALAKDPHSGEAEVRAPAERGLLAAGRAQRQWRRRAVGDESSSAVGRGGGALQVAAAGEAEGGQQQEGQEGRRQDGGRDRGREEGQGREGRGRLPGELKHPTLSILEDGIN